MKGKVKLISNNESLDEAERLGISCEEKFTFKDFYFLFEEITMSYLTVKNEIVIFINGESFVLKYDEQLWKRIEEKFSDK